MTTPEEQLAMASSFQVRTDVLPFTGWSCVASSCLIEFCDVAGEPSDAILCGTTREGYLCRIDRAELADPYAGRVAPPDEGDSSLPNGGRRGWRASISRRLLDDPDLLMRMLMRVWRAPSGGLEDHPLHYWTRDDLPRPAGTEAPVILEGVIYKVRMDWAFPYLLVCGGGGTDGTTHLFPFEIADTYIGGHKIERAGSSHWSKTRLLRFFRIDQNDRLSDYRTEILVADPNAPDGTGYRLATAADGERVVEIPDRAPARDNDPLTDLTFEGRPRSRVTGTDRRPRIILPFHDGFLLLLKLWLYTMSGYLRIYSGRIALTNFSRDRLRMNALKTMAEYSHAMNPNPQDMNVRHAAARDILSECEYQINRYEGRVNREFHAQNRATFDFLLRFYIRPDLSGLTSRWLRDWHLFPHYLGPITFLKLGIWAIRNSPYARELHESLGEAMIRPPGQATDDPAGSFDPWTPAEDPNDDIMLVDRRFVGIENPPELAEDPTAWLKRSITVFAMVNRWFIAEHMEHMWSESHDLHARAEALGRVHTDLPSTRRTLASIESAAKELAQLRRIQSYAEYIADWEKSSETVRRLIGPRSPSIQDIDELLAFLDGGPYTDGCRRVDDHNNWVWQYPRESPQHSAAYHRHEQRVLKHSRLNLPAIATALSAVSVAFLVKNIAYKYRTDPRSVTATELANLLGGAFGLSPGVTLLLGKTPGRIVSSLGFLGDVIGVVTKGSDTYSSLRLGNIRDAGESALGAAGDLLVMISMGIELGSSGAATPLAVGVFVVGTLMSVASDIMIWWTARTTPQHQAFALSCWQQLTSEGLMTYSYQPMGGDQAPSRLHAPFVRILEEYQSQRMALRRLRELGGSLTDVFANDEYWDEFPEAQWQFVDMNRSEWQARYVRFARAHGVADPLHNPPPTLTRRP